MLNLVSSGPLGNGEVHFSLEKAPVMGISDLNGASRKPGKQKEVSVRKDLYALGTFCLGLRNGY